MQPRLFTIPASAPFLPTLIAALAEGRLVPSFAAGSDPLALADAAIYLPTRRACRAARDLFLQTLGTDAAILPRIVAIGDIDEDELAFAEAASGAVADEALALPDALSGLKRRMLLAELVRTWSRGDKVRGIEGAPLVAANPAAALALADDLGRLMDDMVTREVPWSRLDKLVPAELEAYWQLTLEFLKIARETWPAILAAHRAIEPAERRDRLIAAEARRLAGARGPVIAAGSTGSMPATAKLLATIATLPHGAVVLPGLDTMLDARSWDLIAGGGDDGSTTEPVAGHPQFAMHALLRRLKIGRDDVVPLAAPAAHGRERLLSEALRPAAATEQWRERIADDDFAEAAAAGLAGIAVIEAAHAEEEALAIAVVLREAAEEPDRTAALVTPDRTLARRVLAALHRWNVVVDDSGGDALADTPAGVFARLAAEVALGGTEPVPLLALLKHPRCRLGGSETAHGRAVIALERALLRGPRPRAGTAGLAHALATLRHEHKSLHPSDPRRTLRDFELDAAGELIAKLTTALGPLESLKAQPLPFGSLAARHAQVLQQLGGEDEVFAGHDGEALMAAFEEIAESIGEGGLDVAPPDYPELFLSVIADRVVRKPLDPTARIRVFGPLEARLQTADRVVIGGLNEGTWPPEARSDQWLSRPMRHELGLDLPERRIGLSAHDFAQALGAREIVLTRAAKIAGAPSVASRFLQRLVAVAGTAWSAAVARGTRYLDYARALDQPAHKPCPIRRPAPKPPRAVRPARLSVTEIEHWLRDPYTIYAKHVLRLAPLDAVDTMPGAADRGTVIHEALGTFSKRYADKLPADPVGALLAIGEKLFEPLKDYPEARAFWWPRFMRIAHWYGGWAAARRAGATATHAEIQGEYLIPLGERSLKLTARADHIEQLADGSYAVIDYKTGTPPSEKQVRSGLSPQLTLETAILRNGGFKEIPAGASVSELTYVRLRGGHPAGEPCRIAFKEGGDADAQAECALARLTAVAQQFEDESTPYRSLVHPMWKARYGDYDHLARVKEWSMTGGLDDEANGGPE